MPIDVEKIEEMPECECFRCYRRIKGEDEITKLLRETKLAYTSTELTDELNKRQDPGIKPWSKGTVWNIIRKMMRRAEQFPEKPFFLKKKGSYYYYLECRGRKK